MQRFSADRRTYEYSPEHAPIGTVEAGERFAVECVEGFSNYFASAADFSPERYALAEAVKWAVVGPIAVAGAEPGGAVAVTIHAIDVISPGVVVYGAYTDEDPYAWWDDESACEAFPVEGGAVRFDERGSVPLDPLVGCLATVPADGPRHARLQGPYGGNMDARLVRAGATLVLPASVPGAGLYFGDCKTCLGDGEIVGPPEIGALVTASAEPRPRPASMRWPRVETADALAVLASARPLEVAARAAFRDLLDWVLEDHDLPRARAALLLGMVAHAGICQISNDEYTASCTVPRSALAPWARG